MNNITLGQYVPLNSKIHRIDPRMKIIAMIILMVGVMIVPNFYGYAFLFAILTLAILISKLTISFVIKAMKPMLMMMIILFILNIFRCIITDTLYCLSSNVDGYGHNFIDSNNRTP